MNPVPTCSTRPQQTILSNGRTAALNIRAKRLITIVSIVFFAAALILGIWGWQAGLFTSMDALLSFLHGLGGWTPFVFVCIQVLQVVIPIIPGGITCAASVILFGPVWGFVYSYAGLMIGSILVFLLARGHGIPLVQSIVSPKLYHKYVGWLDKEQPRFNKLFAIGIFLPFMPDDFLCMLAGVSKMKFTTFLWINVLLKIPFLLPYSFGVTTIMGWLRF